MAVNKVEYGNQVVIDISDSTVDANSLLAGLKAYGADGEPITGRLRLAYHITCRADQYAALPLSEQLADENFFYVIKGNPTMTPLDSNVTLLSDSVIQTSGAVDIGDYDISDFDEIQILFNYGNGGTYSCHTIAVDALKEMTHADFVDYSTPHWMVDSLGGPYARITYDEANDGLYIEEMSAYIGYIYGIKFGGSHVTFQNVNLNDNVTSANSTWSSNKIQSVINGIDIPEPGAVIDDTDSSSESTWSSEKIAAAISAASSSSSGGKDNRLANNITYVEYFNDGTHVGIHFSTTAGKAVWMGYNNSTGQPFVNVVDEEPGIVDG